MVHRTDYSLWGGIGRNVTSTVRVATLRAVNAADVTCRLPIHHRWPGPANVTSSDTLATWRAPDAPPSASSVSEPHNGFIRWYDPASVTAHDLPPDVFRRAFDMLSTSTAFPVLADSQIAMTVSRVLRPSCAAVRGSMSSSMQRKKCC